MLRSFSLLVLCIGCFAGTAQGQRDTYFQQTVDYDIRVTLDDRRHYLHGEWSMQYTNHSPDTLAFLYLHLWPNAYQSDRSAFAQQQLRQQRTRFRFAPDHERGHMAGLRFTVDGEVASSIPYEDHPDVVQLLLPQPLLPGGSIRIHSPLAVKIPASFSRLGHLGQSYQLTQWYPKPAVYDRQGWHPLPYLDQGEFYSEFGTYDVHLTLPANYLVGATGSLETVAEQEWLSRYSPPPLDSFPPSSDSLKTLHYHAERVHDFAWFADKRFTREMDTLQLSSGRIIECQVFYTATEAELWQQAMTYVKRATRFYSERVGEYPWPQVTAVQSALSAGAGMEYPMITVIGLAGSDRALDEVITHEVGHNWFYGLLANNERAHAWMDEGINTYYEQRYLQQYYAPLPSAGLASLPAAELSYLYPARLRADQAPATSSADFTAYNYWLGAYTKPALALHHLEQWLGQPTLDRAMQQYYQEWRFKHPSPTDLRQSLERSTGQSLGWLFDGYLGSTGQTDYRIRRVRIGVDSATVTLENRGQIAAPVPIAIETDSQRVYHWLPGFARDTVVVLPHTYGESPTFILDPSRWTLDVNRRNDVYRTGRTFPRLEPFAPALLGWEDARKRKLFFLPLLGWNAHNGLLLGLALHNRALLPRRLEWLVAPMLGQYDYSLAGWGGLRYRIFPAARWLRELDVVLSAQQFDYRRFRPEPLQSSLKYRRISSGADLILGQYPAGTTQQRLSLRLHHLSLREGSDSLLNTSNQRPGYQVYRLQHAARNKHALHNFHLQTALTHRRGYDVFDRKFRFTELRLSLDKQFPYALGRRIDLRLFAGYFLSNDLRRAGYLPPEALSLVENAYTDYDYNGLFVGREADNWAAQQIDRGGGGFRIPLVRSSNVGRSNDYLLTASVTADLPLMPAWLRLRPYLDVGYYRPPPVFGRLAGPVWVSGLALEWLDGRIGLYLPLLGSDLLLNPLREQSRWSSRLAFRLALHDLSPWELADERFY